MSFDEEQDHYMSKADFAQMCDHIKSLEKELAELKAQSQEPDGILHDDGFGLGCFLPETKMADICNIPVVILRHDITHIVNGEKFYFESGTPLYIKKDELTMSTTKRMKPRRRNEMTQEREFEMIIKDVVDKFLGWRLPDDFSPDHFISFDKKEASKLRDRTNGNSWPVGTNLLDAEQAKEMFTYCLQAATAKADARIKELDELERETARTRLESDMRLGEALRELRQVWKIIGALGYCKDPNGEISYPSTNPIRCEHEDKLSAAADRIESLEKELAENHEAFELVKRLHIKATIEVVELRKELAALKSQSQEPVSMIKLMQEAREIVWGKFLCKKFIDGTPLSNDIAVWMAEFAYEHAAPPLREGWVMVPREPNSKILDEIGGLYTEAAQKYKAMIAASEDGRNV